MLGRWRRTTAPARSASIDSIEDKAAFQKRMEREWMEAWVRALPAAEEEYIRKQPGLTEAEVQRRLVHWERRRIENRVKSWNWQ